jgi:hypothetical protein
MNLTLKFLLLCDIRIYLQNNMLHSSLIKNLWMPKFQSLGTLHFPAETPIIYNCPCYSCGLRLVERTQTTNSKILNVVCSSKLIYPRSESTNCWRRQTGVQLPKYVNTMFLSTNWIRSSVCRLMSSFRASDICLRQAIHSVFPKQWLCLRPDAGHLYGCWHMKMITNAHVYYR